MTSSEWIFNNTFNNGGGMFEGSPSHSITSNSSLTTMFTSSPFNTTRIDYCKLPRKLTNDVAFGFLIFFIPITIIGNLLVVAVVFSSASLRKQTAYLFLASLAVADTLVGLVSMPFNARVQWRGGYTNLCLGGTACWVYLLGEIFLSIASVTHLFVIGIDRYLSLKYVYQYNSMTTRNRVGVTIITIWGFSALVAFLAIFKWDDPSTIAVKTTPNHVCGADNMTYFTTVYVTCFILPLFTMAYTYHYVYKTASRHIAQIVKMEIANPNESKRSRDKKRKKRQYRTLRSIVVVFVVYCICWYPTIFYILSLFHAKEFWKKYRHQNWWKALHFLLINFLPPLNSTTNPFIYVISNKQFRKVCTQLYFKMGNREQRSLRYATTMMVSEAQKLQPALATTNKNKFLSVNKKLTTVLTNSNTSLNENTSFL